MGRLLITGHGRGLYDRKQQRTVVEAVFPKSDESPDQALGDVEGIMWSMMCWDDEDDARTFGGCTAPFAGGDPMGAAALMTAVDAMPSDRLDHAAAPTVGGPLYPPLNAVVYAPFALISPRLAYRIHQVLGVLLVFAIAWGIRQLAQGRIWWPVAAFALFIFPGLPGSVALAQNAVFSLAIFVGGWLLLSRGHDIWAGVVWGLFAYKPVWAMAFFLVPVLMLRWRMALAMLASGVALAGLTLPFVGVQTWRDWLHVGSVAAELYKYDTNWVPLSRDLLGIPRRWWTYEILKTDPIAASLVGWGLWAAVLEITVRTVTLRVRRPMPTEGPAAAFLLLGAWLTCYHFMHYDIYLAALPVLLLFTHPEAYIDPLLRRLSPRLKRWLGDDVISVEHKPPSTEPASMVLVILVAIVLLTQPVFGLLGERIAKLTPWDTLALALIWLWCGWRLYRQSKPRASADGGCALSGG
jgi:hypothetical protein